MRYISGGILGGIVGALAAGYIKPTQSSMTLVIIAAGLLLGLLAAWAFASDKPLPLEEELRQIQNATVTEMAGRVGQSESAVRQALNALVTAGVATHEHGVYTIKPKRRR